MQSKELIVIGGGIAGVSSVAYAKRAGLDLCIFEPKTIGGQLLFIENVDNYPGVDSGVKGRDLAEKLAEELRRFKITPLKEEVKRVKIDAQEAVVETEVSSYRSKGLIVATGAAHKKLGVKGEDFFSGKGVSYCALCDGFFFKDKTVGVVGGGNTALEEALYLSQICKRVYLIHRRDKLRALDYLIKNLKKCDNIEVIYDSKVKELKGESVLREIILENPKAKTKFSLPLTGLFIAIGVRPNTEFFGRTVSRDKDGFILTDEEMKTSSDFIWACGDCRKRPLRQLITAASEGAIAALSAYRYLKGYYISS